MDKADILYFSVSSLSNFIDEVLYFKDSDNQAFYSVIMQLHKEYHLKQKNWSKLTESLIDVLLQYIIAWTYGGKKDHLVEKFENILISNISNVYFRLDEAMEQIPLSGDHFRKLFKKETGKTPLQYLIDKKINYAINLLENRTDPFVKISNIAKMAGFSDPYYFSRLFRKTTGKSPSQWAGK